ncbi:hypothetical protein HARCEL1_11725 [Halococcoides cellulosivorans]|uniref:Uncharacterized protein n=2 Tax=Halococcoides cellulosivorans TaxID=1679096 RepID=A0A2R4X3F3_9EURY|nr:hypothetical protein HARCEL1_11725 [Halococcoides cellulosivorans]
MASTTTASDVLTRDGAVALVVENTSETGQTSHYSLLVHGDIQASSILSTDDPAPTVTVLDDDTVLVAGSVTGGTAGFVLDGQVVAAEVDGADPTLTVGDRVVDPGRWPTVTAYTGHGPEVEPVTDPFPNGGELGATPEDPLYPEEYVLELSASGLDAADAYCFDVDGTVLDHSDDVRVSELGDRVYGSLQPDSSARIEVRGTITRIDTADGIEFAVRARDDTAA